MGDASGPLFQTTIWHRIREAQSGSRTALNDILSRYRPAIVGFLRRKDVAPEDAEDLSQEVLLALSEAAFLDKVDRARGRFRSLVVAVTKNILGRFQENRSALKRGGGRPPLPLDRIDVAAPAEDDVFDREWTAHLLRLALARLEREQEAGYRALELHLDGRTYREIAERVGRSVDAVDGALRQARARLAAYLREEIATYASTPDECRDEEGRLFRFLLLETVS